MPSVPYYFLLILALFSGLSCHSTMTTTTKAGYTLQSSSTAPLNTHIYTLNNGLKVYMSVNKDAPRIQTMVAVKAGSKNDPADATGLAHYLEHMLFKGSSKIGSLDWEKEKVVLQQISDLYEDHRKTTDETARAAIYQQIDSLSSQAAQYVAANEYDKLAASIGAEGTNAFTSLDRTVYINDIPANEIDRWLQLEAERFNELVLRLFHTELETVYEEYNRAQTSDSRKVWQAMAKTLLPNHPYGTQTTLGSGAHLKNPSMEKIHKFFSTYYVPNNMAIILSGDFEPEAMIQKIVTHWGSKKAKRIPKWKIAKVPTATKTQEIVIRGKEKERVQLGWQLGGATSEDALLAELTAGVLFNRRAGLMDVNLLQQQEIGQGSAAVVWSGQDYSFFMLYGEPREFQQLSQVSKKLYEQIALLKQGDFEDSLLEAVINNKEIQLLKSLANNRGRSFYLLDAFVFDQPWDEWKTRYERMRALTKQDVMDFANRVLAYNKAVVIYKQDGEATAGESVEKPPITPVVLNKEDASTFKQGFDALTTPSQEAVFLNYNQQITRRILQPGLDYAYIKNDNNQLFELTYVYEMGALSDPLMPLAIRYLQLLGTDDKNAEAFQKELFRLGLTFQTMIKNESIYLHLSGLDRSLEEGVALIDELMCNFVTDTKVLQKMISDVKKSRADRQKDKHKILQVGMLNYAYYGNSSPLAAEMPTRFLDQMSVLDLKRRLDKLSQYQHTVFYYGPRTTDAVANVVEQQRDLPKTLLETPANGVFPQLPIDNDKVVFVPYEGMPQVEIMMVSKGSETFNLEQALIAKLYNEYFGRGLSSIVFQEIREARALAYSTYVTYTKPAKKEQAHYLRAFVGTQADKLQEATIALRNIVDELPIVEAQVDNALQGILKRLETERITGASVFWDWRAKQRLGLDQDLRQLEYDFYKKLENDPQKAIEVLQTFHKANVKNKAFTFLVLGDPAEINMGYLNTLGPVEQKTISQLFGEE